MSETFTAHAGQLATALQEADLRVLQMVLVHHTGDLAWLEPPFAPQRDVRLIPDPGAGLSQDAQQRIRDAAFAVLSEGRPPRLLDPGNDLMHRMMSICLGEKVPFEYAELMREELGLKHRFAQWEREPAPRDRKAAHVLIVGAGVCGIALAVSLQKLNIPFTILDKNPDVGGTWFVNRYPGSGVDTPNHAYSYSFGPHHNWSRYFSRREEVQAYLSRVADQFRLREHIRFETHLEGSAWDTEAQVWRSRVRGPDGTLETLSSRCLISAIGQLSDPSIPHIAGAGDFQGPNFHSVAWPDELDVSGKRVAVIGTGATAMQLVPAIADTAANVDVFQRTAQWSRPIAGYRDPIGPGQQYLLEHVPLYAEWFRLNMFWRYGDGLLRHLKKDDSWPHPERAVNAMNDRHRQEMVDFIASELSGAPELVAKCVPDYPAYGKRILLDNNWYKTLLKDNVELVTERIERITADGILMTSGRLCRADIVVYATGFKLTELAARLNLTGRDGTTLSQVWEGDNPAAYLGIAVPQFPNFFCMLGPGSGPGHGGSVVFQAECQARYISACIVQMVQAGITSLEIKTSAFEHYMQKADAEHETLIWSHPSVATYYKNARGRVFTVMPWRFVDYWRLTHDPKLEDYETVPPAAPPSR